jgi:hypothetical protein
MIVELTLLPIAMIIVFLRMWVRIGWLHKSWYDDYLMILAMVRPLFSEIPSRNVDTCQVFSIGTTILVIMASQLYGWDRHVWDVPLATLETGRQVRPCATSVTLS